MTKIGKDAKQKIEELKNLCVPLETTTINPFELFEGAFKLQKYKRHPASGFRLSLIALTR